MSKIEQQFRAICEEMGYDIGEDEDAWISTTERSGRDAFEDDGFLHFHQRKQRFCVYLGQDTPAETWNENAKRILTACGFADLISGRCLQDIPEDEDECPHCGNRRH